MQVIDIIKKGLSKAKDPSNRLSLVFILAILIYTLAAFSYEIFLFPRPFSTILGLIVIFYYCILGLIFIAGIVWKVTLYRKQGHQTGFPFLISMISLGIVLLMPTIIRETNLSFRLNFNMYQEFAAKVEAGEIGPNKRLGNSPRIFADLPEEYTSLTSRPEVVVYNDTRLAIVIFPRDHGLFNSNAFIYQSAGISPDSRTDEAGPVSVVYGWYHCKSTFHGQWFECYRD